MTPTQIEALTRKQGDILSIIEGEVGSSTMDLIQELLEIERTLSLEENK